MSKVVDLLMQNAKADVELLIKNDKRGDVFSIPREVDFLLKASSFEKAELVSSFINDFSFGSAIVLRDEAENRVSIRIMMPVTHHIICSVSGFMVCLGKLFDCEYDGWGSVVQTSE